MVKTKTVKIMVTVDIFEYPKEDGQPVQSAEHCVSIDVPVEMVGTINLSEFVKVAQAMAVIEFIGDVKNEK